MKIAVSFLKSKFDRVETIKKIDESIADFIHVDLMDGYYVPENNFEVNDITNILKGTTKPLDFHLMVNEPLQYISSFAKLKPETITIHLNTCPNLNEVIDLVKEYNIKVGIALNPNEDVHLLDSYLDKIDYVLLMSVYPGKGGQTFISDVLNKVAYLKSKNVLIGIDGGVNNETIKEIKNYDIDIVISGSYICMSDNYNERINLLK